MALDREKTFANAERLLKQGKIAQALDECKRLAEDAPKDLLMLNRVGRFPGPQQSRRRRDRLLRDDRRRSSPRRGSTRRRSRSSRRSSRSIPDISTSIVHLGELNLKQKLPGEARTWLLQAAEGYLRAREFAKAREVYEKLVAAEPDNVDHVVRLAEARAAEGIAERARPRADRAREADARRRAHRGRRADVQARLRVAAEPRGVRRRARRRCQVASGKLEEGLRLAG